MHFLEPLSMGPFLFLLLSELGLTAPSSASEGGNTNTFLNSIHHGPPASSGPRTGVIMPALFVGVLFLVNVGFAIYDSLSPKTVKQTFQKPEEQENLVLCTSDMTEFDYTLIFRVGIPTPKFNLKTSYIDIAILGPEDELIGCPVRFKCSLLTDLKCSELHCPIGTILPLPKITGIQANHNSSGSIVLYDYTLIDNNTGEREQFVFMEQITNKPTIFRPRPLAIDQMGSIASEGPSGTLLIEWTRMEALNIFTAVTMSIGGIVLIFEYTNAYFAFKEDEGSLYRAAMDVLFVAPICLAELFGIIFAYKHLKKNAIISSQMFPELEENCASVHSGWHTACRAFVTGLIVISLCFAGEILALGVSTTFIKSLFWLDATFVVWVLVMGAWKSYETMIWLGDPQNKSLLLRESNENKASQSMGTLAHHYRYAIPSGVNNETKTIYVTAVSSIPQSKVAPSAVNSFIGPVLLNPNAKSIKVLPAKAKPLKLPTGKQANISKSQPLKTKKKKPLSASKGKKSICKSSGKVNSKKLASKNKSTSKKSSSGNAKNRSLSCKKR